MGRQALAQAVCLLVILTLTTACTQAPAAPAPNAAQPGGQSAVQAPLTQTPSPAQVYTPPGQPGPDSAAAQPEATEAVALLPAADTLLTYDIRDRGTPDSSTVQEYLLRDGDRAIAVANGHAYAVWQIRPDGLWRADPRNPGTLLRYLPAQLSDGLYWRQRSDDADIWFRLAAATQCSYIHPACWEVVVLNRSERTAFRFAGPTGPLSARADNWAEPARSFEKFLNPEVGAAKLSAAERAALLKEAAASPPPAPVVAATQAQFEDAVFAMLQSAQPSLQTERLDLNGDGRSDILQGRLGEWTNTPLQFYQPDGSPVGFVGAAGTDRLRVTRLTFAGMRLPAFLVERPEERGFYGVAIVTARENPYNHTWSVEPVYGWAPKASGVVADRVTWTPEGKITVEWEMADPARHTRVTTYSWFENPEQRWSGVRRDSVTYRPAGQALRYPTAPGEVLEAAFVARWLGLTEELTRYFATPEAAAAFAADERVSTPDYGPGSVQIGTLTPRDRTESCGPSVAEAAPQGPGPHSFVANWGGYEWCASAWGTVTFGADAQGRPVINELRLEAGTAMGE